MNTPTRAFVFAFATFHSLLGVSLAAETQVTLPPSVPSLPATSSRSLIELDFPGGTFSSLVSAIGTSTHTTFNLIGEKPLTESTVPAFVLRDVEFPSLVSALSNLLRQQNATVSLSGTNIFVVARFPSFGQPSSTPTFQTFQIGPYLAALSVDAITDAVRTAWEASPTYGAKPITFKFHEATKLLFVYGPPEAITVANVVIPQLNPAISARLRNEFSLTARPSADEVTRLNQTVDEIQRRRAVREAGAVTTSPAPTKEK